VEIDGQAILKDVSLRVRAGEVVAVMGPNGGGKSTLLHSLMGLAEPAAGSVRICGEPVSPRAISTLARRLGTVFQIADHQLVADSVRGEAIFAAGNLGRLDPKVEGTGDDLLARTGLAERRADHPFRLSWGQKRRLNLISAVLHGPKLLLLDELFAGQDWENVTTLLDIIGHTIHPPDWGAGNQQAECGACIMITHDPRIVVRCCHRLLFLCGGRIAVDAEVPVAMERLREMGHDAFITTANGGSGPVTKD
jgi:energy-coupling factor transport system ATP-binding protein